MTSLVQLIHHHHHHHHYDQAQTNGQTSSITLGRPKRAPPPSMRLAIVIWTPNRPPLAESSLLWFVSKEDEIDLFDLK